MDTTLGITKDEAGILLARFGPNEITAVSKRGAVTIFFSQFTSVLVILLLIASLISFLLSDVIDGVFILLIVILNSILGFI